jgi:hypothetical protein
MDSAGDLSRHRYAGEIAVGTLDRLPPALNRNSDLDSVGATFMVARRGSPDDAISSTIRPYPHPPATLIPSFVAQIAYKVRTAKGLFAPAYTLAKFQQRVCFREPSPPSEL